MLILRKNKTSRLYKKYW